MTIDTAIREAIKYETRIRDLYAEASNVSRQEEARALFQLLEKEEASHLQYLEFKLGEWKEKGIVTLTTLASALPNAAKIEEAVAKAKTDLKSHDQGGEENALERALKAEEETSAFYRSLVSSLSGKEAALFARFVEIEEGHTLIVRAELDLATRTGHWFDVRVFDLED